MSVSVCVLFLFPASVANKRTYYSLVRRSIHVLSTRKKSVTFKDLEQRNDRRCALSPQ